MKNLDNQCRFYIVRHGQTHWNALDRLQGHLNSDLTEKGIAQAKKTAEELKNVKFDAVFSSDLLRAKDTAEIIKLNRELEVKTTEAIRERSYGSHEGKLGSKFRKDIKKLLKKYKKLSEEEKWHFKFDKDYESDEQLSSRFITFLREVAVAYENKTVLIVTHGAVIRIFLTKIGFAKHGQLPHDSIKNAGYVIVDSNGVDFFVREQHALDKDAKGSFV